MMQIDPAMLARVGIAYHPFLHGMILAQGALFDVVEIPLDLYADEARRGLLDPGLTRLRAIAAGRSVLWRGADLPAHGGSSGDFPKIVALPAQVAEAVGAAPVSVAAIPSTSAAGEQTARALGRHCDALSDHHACGVVIELPLDRLAGLGSATSRAWLGALASATACPFAIVIGPDGSSSDAAVEIIGALPPGRIDRVILASIGAAAWPVLDIALASTGAGSVVIRRERHLFPIGDILDAAARCRDALRREAPTASMSDHRPASTGVVTAPPMPTSLRDGAAALSARQVWREHVKDMHHARQLARWGARPEAFV